MPSYRLPRARRLVVVLTAVLLGLVGMLPGPRAAADAYPYAEQGLGPVLTLPDEATFVLGRDGDEYVIAADGDPAPAIGVDSLPAGLRLTAHGDGSATIAGTPTGPAGTTSVEVQARNSDGVSVESLPVVVQQAPSFVARGPIEFTVGEPAAVLVRATGYPAPGIGVEGDLPPGLAFVDNGDGTATLAGTPSGGVSSTPVTLTAVNVVSDTSLSRTIRVLAPAVAVAGPIPLRYAGPDRGR